MEPPSVSNTQMENVSYIRARDQSIFLDDSHHHSNVKTNLNAQLLESGGPSTSSGSTNKETPEDDNLLKVYLRIKKSDDFKELYEVTDDNTLLCKIPEGAQCIRHVRNGSIITKTFTFSKIFGSESNQTELFNGVVKRKVLHFINGYNCSLLTYGASVSGKTFTIVGTADEPGIIPRALEYLFRSLPPLPEQPLIKPTASGGIVRLTESACEVEKAFRQSLIKSSNVNIDRAQHTQTYKAMQQRLSEETVAEIIDDISDDVSLGVWVSFAEIYNEHVYDLLKPEPPRGRSRQKLRLGYSNGSAYIKDLSCVGVSSGLHAYHILQYGLHNLKYAATSLNEHSSRSHCIFTIKLAQASNTQEGVSVNSFNFCDLAGSERVNKTQNAGERLKESNNINKSLLVLGRCVHLIRESQKQNDNRLIPFRESKLTQLFQKALLGHEAISMIVNINPARHMFDESQHVLNFSAIAKDVIIAQPRVVRYPKNNRLSPYVENKNVEVDTAILKSEIEELRQQVQLLQEEKLKAEEDKQQIITTYEQLLEDTNKHWEDRCQKLQDTSTKCLRAAEESSQQQKTCIHENNIIALQNQLKQIKLQLQAQTLKLLKSVEEIKLLNETLEDANTAYKDLETKYINYVDSTTNLDSELVKKEEEINDLSCYILALQNPEAARDADEDEENAS